MKLSTTLTTILLLPLISAPEQTRAEFVVFDFHDVTGASGMDLDELESGTSAAMGMVLSASTSFVGDKFNYTSSGGFGINSENTGDDTDAFDLRAGTNTPEMMTFSFAPTSGSVMITFESIKFDRFDVVGNDMGSLAHLGGGFTTFNFGDADLDSDNVLLVQQAIAAGDTLRLAYVGGNGFGLESITLNVTAVPEPSLAITLNLLFAFALAMRRRRRKC